MKLRESVEQRNGTHCGSDITKVFHCACNFKAAMAPAIKQSKHKRPSVIIAGLLYIITMLFDPNSVSRQ